MHANYFLWRDLHAYIIGGVAMNMVTFLMIYVSTKRLTQYHLSSVIEDKLANTVRGSMASTTDNNTVDINKNRNPTHSVSESVTIEMMLSSGILMFLNIKFFFQSVLELEFRL